MLTSPVLFQILLTFHLIGLALGLGGVAVTDFSFFRTLRMGDRLTPESITWMRLFSTVIWIGLGILGVSGVGLFLFHPAQYLASPGFLAKMVFVAILAINGLFLNYYTTVRLTTFNFSQLYTRRDAAWKARKLSFIFGAISTTSWYAAVLAAMFKGLISLSFWEIIGLYVVALSGAIITALCLERLLMHRKLRASAAQPSATIADLALNPPPRIPVHPAPPLTPIVEATPVPADTTPPAQPLGSEAAMDSSMADESSHPSGLKP